jgi:thiol:disulfide interchange protein DsbD
MFAVGLYFMAPSWGSEAVIKGKEIQWIKYSESEFQNAPTQGKPVIIDFYADWCVPCKELDGQTFTDSNVVSESERFIMMKADLTKSGSPEIESLRKKFNIQGVPTVVFFDSNGNETNRIVQFLPAEKFLPLMKK